MTSFWSEVRVRRVGEAELLPHGDPAVFLRNVNTRHFLSLFWSLRPIDPVVFELCRLRVAQLLGGDAVPPMEQESTGRERPSPEQIAALEQWRDAAVFSARERACLAFAEKFVLQPHGVTDEDAAVVAAYLSDKEMIAFTEALAVIDGFTRFRIILGIEERS